MAIFIAVISAVWMDVSSGSATLLMMFVNTVAKPTFLPVLFACWLYVSYLVWPRIAYSCCEHFTIHECVV